jgi:hypothetical protein
MNTIKQMRALLLYTLILTACDAPPSEGCIQDERASQNVSSLDISRIE